MTTLAEVMPMKNNNNEFTVKRKKRGYEAFLLIYIIIIIVPSIIMASGSNAWINILLALGLVVLMLFYYFDHTYDTSVSWGIKAIYTEREQERYFMDYHRTHFWKETDIMLSYDIKRFIKSNIRELGVMAKLGSKMRILLLDPQSKYVPLLEKASSMKHGEYAYYVLQIQSFALRAAQAGAENTVVNVELKYYDAVPLDNMLRAYDTVFAYNNKECAQNDFKVCLFENELNGYNFYKTMFDEKWNDLSFSYNKEITAEMVPDMRYFADNDTIDYTI